MSKWTVQLLEDPVTGDLILPLPNELMETMGWVEGDTLEFDVQAPGSIILRKHIDTEA